MNKIYSVSQVNQYVKSLFVEDYNLNDIMVQGELSNCKYHTSGHIYFTLKDSLGQISGVMFAGYRRNLTFKLEDGQNIIVSGNINVYERDGKYQLYASKIVLDGQGLLYEKYEKLKKDLKEEGLFEKSHKKSIPRYAKTIGIVTAKTGAALQDIINVTRRRNPYIKLILYCAKVQGIGAALTIVDGIKELDKSDVDIIIIGRGGGSIEDLWAFNEEVVARAIFECKTPIISAVGHETDETISDFASDLRAPTPSAAAELAVFDYYKYLDDISFIKSNLYKGLRQKLHLIKSKVREFELRLIHNNPEYIIKQNRQLAKDYEDRLSKVFDDIIKNKKHKIELYISRLEGLSPLSKIKRGYALVANEENKAIQKVEDVKVNDFIYISLIDGEIKTKVVEINKR